jgi:hypothetical protein
MPVMKEEDGLFTSIPRLIAWGAVFPLMALVLWLAWNVSSTSRDVKAHWPLVQAQVVAVGDTSLTLEFPLQGNTVRGEVKREYAFKNLALSETIPLYVNPANPAQTHPVGFGELWAGTIALGVVALFLGIVGLFLLRAGDDKMPARLAEQFRRDMQAAQLNGDSFHDSDARPPRHEDDGRTIELREPSQSWKANVFWGLLFGLLALIPALMAPPETSWFEKYAWVAGGIAWMIFMGLSAYRNFGRKVICDTSTILVSQAFASKRVALADVKQVTREDVRQQLREIDEIGMSRRDKMRRMDTKAPMIMYVLRDGGGKTLLRLDKDMQPPAAMRRFLDRLENLTATIG